MRKMIFFVLSFLFFLVPSISASEAEIVMDADSGRVLYGKNIDKRMLIASTTKVLTALVVLNNTELKENVTIGEEVLSSYGSSIYIKPNESYTIEELLYGLLLRSGNDAALSLAVYTAGSIEGFVLLMNETAQAIGMKNSTFNNPHGLDEENENMSTVYDMALLMREAMKNNDFRKITNTKKYEFKANGKSYEWYNKNKLLSNYEYATGGKIGYTKRAKHTFVSSATKNGKNLIAASFVDSDQFATHKSLYEKYFSLYEKYKIIDKNHLNIDYTNELNLYTNESLEMLLKKSELSNVKKDIVLFKNPIREVDRMVVGNIFVSIDDKVYKALKIYSNLPKEKTTFFKKIKELFKWSV